MTKDFFSLGGVSQLRKKGTVSGTGGNLGKKGDEAAARRGVLKKAKHTSVQV